MCLRLRQRLAAEEVVERRLASRFRASCTRLAALCWRLGYRLASNFVLPSAPVDTAAHDDAQDENVVHEPSNW